MEAIGGFGAAVMQVGCAGALGDRVLNQSVHPERSRGIVSIERSRDAFV
jgi:hypothetical protein